MSSSHATKPTHASSHSTGAAGGVWTTRRVAVCGLFVALAFVTSFIEIPIFPAASWLKYDPSGIVCMIAGLVFGPLTGLVVSVLPWLIRAFLNPWGALMGAICTVCMTVPVSVVYKRFHTRNGAVAGLALSAAITLAAAIGSNLLVTPLYSGMAVADVAALIVPVLLPFNLVKIAINCAGTLALYKSVSRMIGR